MRCWGKWATRKVQAVMFVFLCAVVFMAMLRSESAIERSQHQIATGMKVIRRYQDDNAVSHAKMLSSSHLSSQDRLKKIDIACSREKRRSLARLSLQEKQILFKHIIVNDEYKFLFCYVPKVASANWKRVLMVLDRQAADVNNIPKVERKKFQFLTDLAPLAAERKLKTYFKFMFVREPLDRLVSAYSNKFVLNNTYFHRRYGEKIVKTYRQNAGKHPKGDDVSLGEFFQHLSGTKAENMNEHWMPYYKLCQPCAVAYNFVGSFENLLPDAQEVLERLKVDGTKVTFPEQQSFYKRVDHSDFDRQMRTVHPKVLKKVMKKYIPDYTLFSYPLPKV